jgi:hypothetical protein
MNLIIYELAAQSASRTEAKLSEDLARSGSALPLINDAVSAFGVKQTSEISTVMSVNDAVDGSSTGT